jgi:transposase
MVVFSEGKVDAIKMRDEVAKRALIPFYRRMKRKFGTRRKVLVMEDGCSVHKGAHRVELQRVKVHKLLWPAQSPDLNPIENLWRMMKKRIKDRAKCPKDKAQMIQFLNEEWDKLTAEDFDNLIKSMQRRVKECIRKNGGATKY